MCPVLVISNKNDVSVPSPKSIQIDEIFSERLIRWFWLFGVNPR